MAHGMRKGGPELRPKSSSQAEYAGYLSMAQKCADESRMMTVIQHARCPSKQGIVSSGTCSKGHVGRVASLPVALSSPVAVTQKDHILVFRGRNAYEFDPKRNVWQNGISADMLVTRTAFCAVTVQDRSEIYAIGGIGLASMEVYSTDTRVWTSCKSMHTIRQDFASVLLGHDIYVLGGRRSPAGHALATVERFNVQKQAWGHEYGRAAVAHMSTARFALAAVAMHGRVYALGGIHTTKVLTTVEVYNPSTNAWLGITSMKAQRSFFSAFVVNGKIAAVGGSSEHYTFASSETGVGCRRPSGNYSSWDKAEAACAADRQCSGVEYDMATVPNYQQRRQSSSYRSATKCAGYYRTCSGTTSKMSGRCSYYNYGNRNEHTSMDHNYRKYTGSRLHSALQVEEYDPRFNAWKQTARLSLARFSFGAAVANENLYIVGGKNESPACNAHSSSCKATAAVEVVEYCDV